MPPADDDVSITEKRVYAAKAGRTDAYVATGVGVVRAAISGDRVGTFELVRREPANDVAVLDPTASTRATDREAPALLLGVAGDNGVHVATAAGGESEPGFTEIATRTCGRSESNGPTSDNPSMSPAVAIGAHDDSFLVALADGELLRIRAASGGGSDGAAPAPGATTVERIGRVDDPVAVDGPLVASGDGVIRAVGPSGNCRLESVGLDRVRDVSGRGIPIAATADGLYRLGNGWMIALDGSFDAVAADGDGHAAAIDAEGTPFVRSAPPDGGGEWGPEVWTESPLPMDDRSAALAVDSRRAVVVTEGGTLCVDAGNGWRRRALGTPSVRSATLAAVGDR